MEQGCIIEMAKLHVSATMLPVLSEVIHCGEATHLYGSTSSLNVSTVWGNLLSDEVICNAE